VFLKANLLTFAGKAILFLAIASLLWPLVATSYDQLLVVTSSKIISDQVALEGRDNYIYFYPQNGSKEPVAGIESFAFHFGLIVTMVLIAATPALRLSERGKFLLLALIFMFLIHIAGLFFVARSIQSALVHATTIANVGYTIRLFLLSSSLVPPLLWSTLSIRRWLSTRPRALR
jgi:hypothetical protein